MSAQVCSNFFHFTSGGGYCSHCGKSWKIQHRKYDLPDPVPVVQESAVVEPVAPTPVIDYEAWAIFLCTYVDFNHGKGISDHAWDLFINGKGPYDE